METLNEQVAIKGLRIRNRLVLPPITTNYATEDGRVTDEILQFYTKRSQNVGLTIVEATAVNEVGKIVPNSLGLWSDEQIAGMKDLVEIIHRQGSVAVIQLNHAGPRCSPDEKLLQGFSPSGVAFRSDVDPVVMNREDISRLVDDFTNAAIRASQAGFDGVEVHGAHLYLLSEFMSPATNKRRDAYGGDIDGRARLSVEIVKSIRKALGDAYPVFFRINVEERIKGGLVFKESVAAARMLKEAGVDVFDISLITYGGFKEADGKTVLVGSSALSKDKPSGANVSLTAEFKEQIHCPVIAVGKFGAGPEAEDAVKNRNIDLVALGRQMICDPGSAGKMLDGNHEEIIPCDECLACFASIGKGKPMSCKVNKNLPQ